MSVDYAAHATSLSESLALVLPPVVVCMSDTVPEGVPTFTGRVPAGCVFWQRAADGTFATSPKDHEACAVGTYTHNLEGSPAHEKDRSDALAIFAELGYLPASELAKVPVLAERRKHVIYGPLATTRLAPDVVMLFVRSSQSLVVSEAVAEIDGGLPPAMGRPACAVVPQSVGTQRAALSLGCCGARAYLDALGDDVALFALPGAKLEAYVSRITALASANKTLTKFHQLRREQIEGGASPTILESLAALQGGG
jgi:uncharacterized protein (DUF169 family)